MINLSERLERIAAYIENEEDIVDIGTDHGYLPLYLLEKNPDRKMIFTDINEGPLVKTKNIILKEFPGSDPAEYDIRLGDGLVPIKHGEVDDVVIAGMGGILIADILSYDHGKTKSFKKLILQPRTAADRLRKWLIDQNLFIYDEDLAYENGRICEIIAVKPGEIMTNKEFKDELDFEFSPVLTGKKSDIVKAWLEKHLYTEKEIEKSIKAGGSTRSKEKLPELEKKIKKLEYILSDF